MFLEESSQSAQSTTVNSSSSSNTTEDLKTDPGTQSTTSANLFANTLRVFVRVFFVIWLFGMLWAGFRAIIKYYYLRRFLHSCEDLHDRQILNYVERIRQLLFLDAVIQVKTSDSLFTPFITGIRRPVLYLPQVFVNLPFKIDQKAIIAHELSHLRRFDLFTQHLLQMLKIVLWFHPVLYWLQNKLEDAQEKSSDEMAAVLLGSGYKYGKALTRSARYHWENHMQNTSTLMVKSESNLISRLNNITTVEMNRLTRLPFSSCLWIVLCSFGIMFLFSLLGYAILPSTKQFNTLLERYGLSQSVIESNQSVFDLNNGFFESTLSFTPESMRTLCMVGGDLNHDGYPDVILGTDAGEPNYVYLNDGTGMLVFSQQFGSPDDKVHAMDLGDVDGDGDLDLVTASFHQRNKVYTSDGEGRFELFSLFGEKKSQNIDVALTNVNNDQNLDVVTISLQNNQNAFYVNNGHGFFLLYDFLDQNINQQSHSLTIEDFNFDGANDILVCYKDNTLRLYQNQNHFRFSLHSDFPLTLPCKYVSKITQTKQDEYILAFLGIEGEAQRHQTLRVDKNHNIRQEKEWVSRGWISDYAVGDVNRDGQMDLVVSYQDEQTELCYGDSKEMFFSPIPLEGINDTHAVLILDLDQDGSGDIIEGNYNEASRILFNQPPRKSLKPQNLITSLKKKGRKQTSRIEGYITNAAGKGIEGVTVTLSRTIGGPVEKYTYTDSNGYYSFKEISPNSYGYYLIGAPANKTFYPYYEARDNIYCYREVELVNNAKLATEVNFNQQKTSPFVKLLFPRSGDRLTGDFAVFGTVFTLNTYDAQHRIPLRKISLLIEDEEVLSYNMEEENVHRYSLSRIPWKRDQEEDLQPSWDDLLHNSNEVKFQVKAENRRGEVGLSKAVYISRGHTNLEVTVSCKEDDPPPFRINTLYTFDYQLNRALSFNQQVWYSHIVERTQDNQRVEYDTRASTTRKYQKIFNSQEDYSYPIALTINDTKGNTIVDFHALEVSE